jgi:hypothetical protein
LNCHILLLSPASAGKERYTTSLLHYTSQATFWSHYIHSQP